MKKHNKNNLQHTQVDYSIGFELLLMQVLGNKGYQTASYVGNVKLFKKYIDKIIKIMERRVDELDMDSRLKEMLISRFQLIRKNVIKLNNGSDKTLLFIDAMDIITRLLGYDWCDGKIYRTPIFSQPFYSMVWSEVHKSGEHFHDVLLSKKKNMIIKRIEIIKQLKKDGFNTSEIAFIFKTTDYDIKKSLATDY